MKQQKHTLYFEAKLNSFEKLNDRFLKAKCYVLALGKNQNKSYLSEEDVNRAYPTLFGVPLVGHLMRDENGNYYLGGHDYKLDVNDGFKLKSQCIPFGFALPSAEPEYEDIVDEAGIVRKYLVCDVVIWIGRYPELAEAKYDSDTFFHQSMEILYGRSEPLKEDNTYTKIIDFSFDALCMLNKSDDPKFNVKPCFPESSIRAFGLDDSKEFFSVQLTDMRKELEELKLYFAESNGKQGGTDLMDEKNVVLEKYGKSVEDLDFSIEEMSVEELTQKMEELFGQADTSNPDSEAKPEGQEEKVLYSATYRQKYEKLECAVRGLDTKDTDEDGNVIKEVFYWVNDFDDEYAYVNMHTWIKDGDCSNKVGRISYTSDEDTVTLGNFEEMVMTLLTVEEKEKLDASRAAFEQLEADFKGYKETYSNTNEAYEILATYRKTKETEERLNAENEILTTYSDAIGKTKEFEELKDKVGEFSLDELKKECIYIVGLYAAVNKQDDDQPSNTLNFSVEQTDSTETRPYNGVFEKYLDK